MEPREAFARWMVGRYRYAGLKGRHHGGNRTDVPRQLGNVVALRLRGRLPPLRAEDKTQAALKARKAIEKTLDRAQRDGRR